MSSVDVIICPVAMVLGPMMIGMSTCSVLPPSLVVVTVIVLVIVLSSSPPTSFEGFEASVEWPTLRVEVGAVDVTVAVAHAYALLMISLGISERVAL